MFSIPALFFSVAAASAPVSSHLTISRCDAGERQQFEKVTCPIELRNDGDKPIRISKGEARFSWDSIDEGVVVPAHGVAYLNAKVDLRNAEGNTQRAFRFATDEPGQATRGSEIDAFVVSALDQERPTLDFGTVKYGSKQSSALISLSSREIKDFRIVRVESKPEWLDVNLDPDGHTIRARVLPNAPWGSIHDNDYVKVRINGSQQSDVWVAVKVDIQGAVGVDGAPVDLGLMRVGDKHSYLIRLSSRDGSDFKVGDLSLDRIKGKATIVPCEPAGAGCKLIQLDVANDQTNGKIDGTLNIDFPEFNQRLPVELVGFLVAKDIKIHKLEDFMQSAGAQSGVSTKPSLNLAAELKDQVLQNAPPPAGEGPLLRWSVAHQTNIYGYIVYRAERENGPFLRVNKQIIRVVDQGGDHSGSYQWRDITATKGSPYWYQIGTIQNDGARENLTGIQKVVAK